MILGRSGSTTEASGSLDRGPQSPQFARRGRGKAASDWRRAVAVVSERRVAQGRALYTERSPAELYRGPGAASASVTPGRRADSERSGPRPALLFFFFFCFFFLLCVFLGTCHPTSAPGP